MVKKDIFVRGIDEELFLKFKSQAVLKKKSIGQALNEAMKMWLEKR